MAYLIEQLIEGRKLPVTVKREQPVAEALALMSRNTFAQLPVVNADNVPIGMITSDAILNRLRHFDVKLESLRVYDVMNPIRSVRCFRPEDDIFELLRDLRETSAALVIDSTGKLLSVVTDYDTSEYFRRRAEDIMLAEDIETTIKNYILLAYPESTDLTDDPTLVEAIKRVTAPPRDRDAFRKALVEFLKIRDNNPGQFPQDALERAYLVLMNQQRGPKRFTDLTLTEYVSLFLLDSHWDRFSPTITLEIDAIRRLFERVCKIRNKLMHFNGEVTDDEREQLKVCITWLENHQEALNAAFTVSSEPAQPELTSNRDDMYLPSSTEASDYQITILEEIATSNESRYAPLAAHLVQLNPQQKEIEVSFQAVEEIIKVPLPAYARQHRSWWANDSISHVQSQQWLEVGWMVKSVNMASERVVFTRIREREASYINFYDALMALLTDDPIVNKHAPPTGNGWHVYAGITGQNGRQEALAVFNFARGRMFRVELYIDTGDKERNKRIFDRLFREKRELEILTGELLWQRLDERRASRIAMAVPGSIDQSPEQLESLRTWAVVAAKRFNNSVVEVAKLVISGHLGPE